MHRPAKLNQNYERGLYVVPNTKLNQKIAKGIIKDGYYYFTSRKEIIEAY